MTIDVPAGGESLADQRMATLRRLLRGPVISFSKDFKRQSLCADNYENVAFSCITDDNPLTESLTSKLISMCSSREEREAIVEISSTLFPSFVYGFAKNIDDVFKAFNAERAKTTGKAEHDHATLSEMHATVDLSRVNVSLGIKVNVKVPVLLQATATCSNCINVGYWDIKPSPYDAGFEMTIELESREDCTWKVTCDGGSATGKYIRVVDGVTAHEDSLIDSLLG